MIHTSIVAGLSIAIVLVVSNSASAAGGILNLTVRDETTDEPVTTRMELYRAADPRKQMPVRRVVPAGIGVVLDRSLELSLPDGGYTFRMIRGPEYRIISGNFSLERSSLDDHSVDLPRMVDMQAEGWTSGDCCVVTSPYSLPLRMISEDLHVAAVLGQVDAKPIAGRDREDPPIIEPMWIREDAICHDGLILYPSDSNVDELGASKDSIAVLTALEQDEQTKVAIENPFAWALPVWLASERIDGFFILGDWLRLDRKILKVKDGRPSQAMILGEEKTVGRWAEEIYWNMLEAGIHLPPLAGGGDASNDTPVGYNRLYVTKSVGANESPREWWTGVWDGNSVATNGPLLRPMLGGEIPGHVFRATTGEVLRLQPEIMLAVRDPVDYLEVIHNGKVHYSARLDEFAQAGGVIPPLEVKQSGWVLIRVVTQFPDHYRVAISAPWYVEFDQTPRVTKEAVDFFQTWLVEYEERLKRLPPEEIKKHIPSIRKTRQFWSQRSSMVNES